MLIAGGAAELEHAAAPQRRDTSARATSRVPALGWTWFTFPAPTRVLYAQPQPHRLFPPRCTCWLQAAAPCVVKKVRHVSCAIKCQPRQSFVPHALARCSISATPIQSTPAELDLY